MNWAVFGSSYPTIIYQTPDLVVIPFISVNKRSLWFFQAGSRTDDSSFRCLNSKQNNDPNTIHRYPFKANLANNSINSYPPM
ncbi:MAG: hypothetical protein COW63_01650 [Bacteroidetes bacterium CG18_big_fil_WC_8_21_14_2_50_41_14]|nr:MAG: hypothetical protein COW63_01650 [Bacteroidetes bacterium CG18_big_fil_WC_8_21_14_2_50_41_14]